MTQGNPTTSRKATSTVEEQRMSIELRRAEAEVKTMEITVRKVEAERVAILPPEMQRWELLNRRANALADSDLVPEAYRGKPSNCMIAMELAERLNASVLMVMQNTDVIHGNLTQRAKFLVAQVNRSGKFTRLGYKWEGKIGTKEWGCRAFAKSLDTGEELVGPLVTIQIAHDEGWFAKNGSKWKTIPELMLMYRAGAWWSRVHAPETGLGLPTTEESEDIGPSDVPREISPGNAKDLEAALLGETPPQPKDKDGETFNPDTGEIIEQREPGVD